MIRCSLTAAMLSLVLLLAAGRPARSNDLELLETGGVAPNAVILVDNSGSMRNHLWDDDFNPRILYPETCLETDTIEDI